jgi:uncharacterized protein (TIGR00730 family)
LIILQAEAAKRTKAERLYRQILQADPRHADTLHLPGAARTIQLLYNRPMLRRICIFCGSSPGENSVYEQAAQSVGRLLSRRGIELVYGGGNVGLMGALANACLEAGGRVIGVIPQSLVDKEVAHTGLTELRVVGSMHERKFLMAELSDAFIALPGGYGTWEELFEMLTWSQLQIHRKICAILNVNGYYDPLLKMADNAVGEGFLRVPNRALLIADTDPERLVDRVSGHPDAPQIQ